MLQFDAKLRLTLCAGSSGSGKTTFALRYMLAEKKFVCRFYFDTQGEYSRKLNLPAAESPEELLCALEDGFCIYDPGRMFPGDWVKGFNFFCQWVYQVCFHLPGRKAFLIDEVWKYCTPNSIPKPLAECIQEGRKRGLEMIFATQRPNRLNEAITNEVSELVCFRLQGRNALETIADLGADPVTIANLPKGNFISTITEDGRQIRGKLW